MRHILPATTIVALLLAIPCLAQEPDEAGEPPLEPAVMARLAERSLLLDGAVINDLLVVVGERGHILRSEDHGRTWQQVAVPTRTTLTGVFLHDQNLGWAVGHDAVILRTSDGGQSWQKVYRDVELESPLFDVWFADAESGFAIGAYGLFLETSDGGETWSSRYISDDDFHLHRLSPADGGRLYIAAEAGNVYRSDNAGQTWISLPSPYEGSLFGVLPLAGDSLLILGLRGHLFRSDDAGQTWLELVTGTEAMLTDAVELADETVLITGLAGVLLSSADNGDSFTLEQQESRTGIATALPAGDGGVILVGEAGVRRLEEPPGGAS